MFFLTGLTGLASHKVKILEWFYLILLHIVATASSRCTKKQRLEAVATLEELKAFLNVQCPSERVRPMEGERPREPPGSAEHQLGMKPSTMPSWCLALPVDCFVATLLAMTG